MLILIILMLSLNDQISTFRKKIEALNINDYIPKYSSLPQQQITLKEVIAQNSFIVESVKMMNEVFKNYCWLNDRIYGKIIEHELSLHNENLKLTSLTNNIDRKMDESIKNARSTYEQTSHKNRKIKQMVQSGLKQIYDQIKTKVNDNQLSDIIKQIIIKYDQGEFIKHDSFESIDNIMTNQEHQIINKHDYRMFTTLNESSIRKTGKVGFDDYYKLKDQIEHHFIKLKRQVTQLETENSHHKDKFSKISLTIDNHISQIIKNKTEINKFGAENKNSTTLYMKQIQKLQMHMKEYMSDQEWKKRFKIFEIRAIDPLKLHFNQGFTQLKNDLKRLKEDIYYKVNMNESLVKQYGQEMHDLRQKVAKQIQEASILQNRFKEVEYKIERDGEDQSRKLEEFMQQALRSNKEFEKNIKKELNEVKTTILKLSNSVEQKAYKAISKKIQTSFQSFEIDLMQNRQFVKNLTTSLSLANDQIKTIKDILSKKANFSDVVHYVEGKADRIDMKQMSNKLQESLANSKPLTSRQMSDTFNLRQSKPRQATTRFRPASKTHKTEVIAFPASQRNTSKSKQHSLSRGRMQLQATARKLLVRDNKSKITKSYSSLITDLRN